MRSSLEIMARYRDMLTHRSAFRSVKVPDACRRFGPSFKTRMDVHMGISGRWGRPCFLIDQRRWLAHPATLIFMVYCKLIPSSRKRGENAGCIWEENVGNPPNGWFRLAKMQHCTPSDRYLQGGGKDLTPKSQPSRHAECDSLPCATLEDVTPG